VRKRKPRPVKPSDAKRFLDLAAKRTGKRQQTALMMAGLTNFFGNLNAARGALGGRPPAKRHRYQAAIDWCIAESARIDCHKPFALAQRAHEAGLIPGIEASEQLTRAIDVIGREVKKALSQKISK
jgi:hypothetical protein